MLRLVTRLCQILERPEGDSDPQWAETGAINIPELLQDWEWAIVSLLAQVLRMVVARVKCNMMRRHPACAGDRYLLKLFRDFVFHQVGDD